MKHALAVGAGGFLGAVARYLVSLGVARVWPRPFPLGTLLINVTGSFVLGWFTTWVAARAELDPAWRLLVATGFVGAYTTFSTFVFESDGMLRAGTGLKAIAYMAASLILGLACVRLGIWLGTERV